MKTFKLSATLFRAIIPTTVTAIAALSLLGFSALALAHNPVERLTADLDLTETQISTISTLFEAHRESMRAEFGERGESGRPDPETRERMKEARDALHEEIIAVLDGDQAEQFEQMITERRERGRRPGRRDR